MARIARKSRAMQPDTVTAAPFVEKEGFQVYLEYPNWSTRPVSEHATMDDAVNTACEIAKGLWGAIRETSVRNGVCFQKL